MKQLLWLFCIPFILACSTGKRITLVLLPDTQSYMVANPDVFRKQVDWIVEQSAKVDFVLHQGDITQNNNDREWQTAADILMGLDGVVPYSLVPGNHDMGSAPGKFADTRNTDLMNTYFPFDNYKQQHFFGGAFEEGKIDNTWCEFRKGGKKWMVISLEFAPRDEVLAWASEVIERHSRHLVIINTHAYMYADNTHHGSDPEHKHVVRNYGVGKLSPGPKYANEGVEIWEKLVRKHANIIFVFSGHVTAGSGVGRLVSQGDHGNLVYQMLANYQKEVSGSEDGTTGYLRVLVADSKAGTINVRTYSPTKDEFKEDNGNEFFFEGVNFDR